MEHEDLSPFIRVTRRWNMRLGLRLKILLPTVAVVIVCMSLSGLIAMRKAGDELWHELESASRHLCASVEDGLHLFQLFVLQIAHHFLFEC